ncbi:MAG TPA: L,D-transpeptidase/peptidoglycan binding protein [Candidatus Anoxymicrobiaceae bacterium]
MVLLGAAVLLILVVAALMELFGIGRVFKGVTIDGVPVGGMTKTQALGVAKEVAAPLNGDVTVHYADKKFQVDPKAIDFKVHPDTMAAWAYLKGRSEVVPVRMFKRLLGISNSVNVPVIFTYNKAKLNARVSEIAKAVNHEPTSARISVASGAPEIVPSSNGVELNEKATADAVLAALSKKNRDTEVVVYYLKPDLTELIIGKIVVIHLTKFRLYLYNKKEYVNDYKVAVGMPQYPTPKGKFHITYKEKNPTWLPTSEWAKDKKGIPQPPGPNNPLGGYWMDLGGGIGIHATPYENSLGSQASHGCIRMDPNDAGQLFNEIKVGTPVFIID